MLPSFLNRPYCFTPGVSPGSCSARWITARLPYSFVLVIRQKVSMPQILRRKVVHKNIISDEIRGADSCVMRTCCRPNPFTEQNAEFIQREWPPMYVAAIGRTCFCAIYLILIGAIPLCSHNMTKWVKHNTYIVINIYLSTSSGSGKPTMYYWLYICYVWLNKLFYHTLFSICLCMWRRGWEEDNEFTSDN